MVLFDESYLGNSLQGQVPCGRTDNQINSFFFDMSSRTLKRPYFGYNLFFRHRSQICFASTGVTALIPRYLPQLKGPGVGAKNNQAP